MVSSAAISVTQYLKELPPERRAAIAAIRRAIRANLPAGYQEGMQYGMISYYVPLARYPKTYNGQALGIAGLASQKRYMAIYLNSVYGDPVIARWFRAAYQRAGKKLDMGKSCVRFRSLDEVPLDVIGQVIAKVDVAQFIKRYESVRARLPHRS